MSEFENATRFFHACESVKGWDECRQFVEPGAPFSAQCEPLVDIDTVENYVTWMTGFCENIAPGSSYVLHSSAYNDDSKTAIFFATYTLRHTGEGGPVPPTGQKVEADYVYSMEFDGDRIRHMTKVWNDTISLQQLGWS